MAKILVIHGAGMNMRGKVQTEIFGKITLPEYDVQIAAYASELGVDIEIFHSNIEGEVVNKLYEANDRGFDAALFNPAGFSRGYPALVAAISQVKFPTVELHISNPVRRGPVSDTATVSQGMSPDSASPAITWRCAACATCWRRRPDPSTIAHDITRNVIDRRRASRQYGNHSYWGSRHGHIIDHPIRPALVGAGDRRLGAVPRRG